MARVLEARAIITATAQGFAAVEAKLESLARAARGVNGVSGRMSALAGGADAVGSKLSAVGRKMTYGITLPSALAARSVYHSVRDFELAANKLKAYGALNEEEMKRAKDLAQRYGSKYSFGPTGVMQGMVEEIKAGFEARHLEAIQQPLLDFATIAEIDVPQAAELAIFALSGFGKMYDKTGRMLEAAPLNQNLRELIDLYAILNKVAPGSIKQISETFKYSAPAAAQLKISPEQLGAFTAVLAQAGIIGPESGVALRSMMVRFLKPTRPALAALSALGMKLDDYIVKNPAMLRPENILSAVEQQTGTLSPEKRARFLGTVSRLDTASGENYEKGLLAAIQQLGAGDLNDADVAGKLATRIMGTAVEKIDIMRFLKDASVKAPNFAAFMAMFMDQRQAVRLANLDNARVTTMLTDMEREQTRARERGANVSRETADTVNSGLIGTENRLRGSYQNLVRTVFDSGVGDTIIKTMDGVTTGIKALSEVNPKILELGTYGVAAAAAIGPLAYILGNLAKAGGAVLKLLSYALPAGTTTALAAAARTPAGAAFLSGLPLMLAYEDTRRSAQRETIEKYRADMMRGGFIAADRDFLSANAQRITLDDVARLRDGWRPNRDGRIDVTVKVDAADGFWAKVKAMVRGAIFRDGPPDTGSTGSTGPSMPEAGPHSP